MAQVDRQAAKKELEEASELRAKADQLLAIAGTLEHEAERHENDAMNLIAPVRLSRESARRRR
jgi:hypothetical protein